MKDSIVRLINLLHEMPALLYALAPTWPESLGSCIDALIKKEHLPIKTSSFALTMAILTVTSPQRRCHN